MSKGKPTTRPYDATSRRSAANENKLLIASAARQLFTKQGYVATTITQISVEASVAAPTVYAVFGSKAAILESLITDAVNDPDVPDHQDWMDAALAAPTAAERIDHFARGSTRILNRAGDVFAVLHEAKFADPDLVPKWEDGQSRRLDGVSRFVGALHDDDLVAADMNLGAAIDVIWSLTSPEVYTLLVERRQWPPDRYGTWLAASIDDALGHAS